MPTTYAIPDGRVAMAATLYTGNATARSIDNTVNGVSFQPDFVWIKDRSASFNHVLQDSVRGATAAAKLSSNLTDAEGSANLAPYGNVSAFNSNGFSLVAGSIDSRQTNGSGNSFVGWQWKAGGTAVSNTAGSITSSVSANTTAGFSVVTWTGTGANATVGHGLGVAPAMIINKPRNAADNWISWHTALSNLGYIYLNTTGAAGSGAAVWNSTLPTSTVFSVGTSSNINSSAQTMVSYCFAPVAGYSAFGSYTGNGSSDGSFIYLGFKPRFVMVKRYDGGTNSWVLWDSSRDPYNIVGNELLPNSSIAESTLQNDLDFLSNGFKLRNTYTGTNASGATYIYMAFAENPFKFANAR